MDLAFSKGNYLNFNTNNICGEAIPLNLSFLPTQQHINNIYHDNTHKTNLQIYLQKYQITYIQNNIQEILQYNESGNM